MQPYRQKILGSYSKMIQGEETFVSDASKK